MISLEELEALDLALWLRTGQAAGQAMHCNQSTVSRRIRRVLDAFNGKICRDDWGLYVQSECDDLLIMERQIHQLYRLGSNGRIRINLPAWSHRQIRDLLGDHEFCSNPEGDFCCENPLQLLRSHVIDACVVTPTQMLGEPSDDLVQIDLYSVPIHLYCLADRTMDRCADDLGDPLELVATGAGVGVVSAAVVQALFATALQDPGLSIAVPTGTSCCRPQPSADLCNAGHGPVAAGRDPAAPRPAMALQRKAGGVAVPGRPAAHPPADQRHQQQAGVVEPGNGGERGGGLSRSFGLA